jgi:RNA polymerase sigma-70 factor (ECF subfamily)
VTTEGQIETVVESHQDFVKSLALSLAPAPGLADDIAQQVFLEFIAKKDAWDLSSDPRPLLANMTRLVARRAWREKIGQMTPQMRELAEHLRSFAEQQPAEPRSDDERQALRHCLAKLPEKSRRIVEVYYFAGVPSPDIARQMQISVESVRQALFRMRTQLRQCIETSLAGKRA